jgi:uncharacterized membrane protein
MCNQPLECAGISQLGISIELKQNSSLLFMTLGLVALILTPYIRVITSVIYFTWKKNSKYVLVTLFVLITLTASLALH